MSIPLRIFDRNQGEKERTQLDIGRNQQMEDATRAQVFADVDSAYAQINSNVDPAAARTRPKYLSQAAACTGHGHICVAARGRLSYGFSECAERLPKCSNGLCSIDRFVSDGCSPVESCRRTRGDSMIEQIHSEIYLLPRRVSAWSRPVSKKFNPAAGAAPPAQVIETSNTGLVTRR